MKVDWSHPAIGDLDAIHNYIAHDSEYYATRFVRRLIEAAETLRRFPKKGRPVPEVQGSHDDVRELLFRSYRVIYRLETERVLILAVIHEARDLGSFQPKPWQATH